MTLVYAVIIAGGKGERLGGVRKAGLRIGSVRLADRVIKALGPVAEPLLISTGPTADADGLPARCVAVPDLSAACAGPLAGVAAAVDALRQRGITAGFLATVAVDTPFLPSDFVARMLPAIGKAPAAYAAWGEDFYPPNAIWRIEAIADLPEIVAGPTPPKSLRALQRELGAVGVDWSGGCATNPFLNLNTIRDLVTLGRLAR